MRYYLGCLLWIAALLFPFYLIAESGFPQLTTVTPAVAKRGDVLKVEGQNLDRAHVAVLYLTDGKNDFKLEIVAVTPASITFKVPADIKPGRFALMVLTAGDEPKLLEEPVKATIE